MLHFCLHALLVATALLLSVCQRSAFIYRCKRAIPTLTLNSSNIAAAIPCQDPHPGICRLTYNIYSSVYHYHSMLAVSFSI